MRRYSHVEELVDNLPYIAMLLLGSAIFAFGFETSLWAWIGAGVYLAYGIVGVIWHAVFVCPHCGNYGTRSCHTGYGIISAKLVRRGDPARFPEKFKRHIPVIVPLWFIPLVAGAWVLAQHHFSWWLLALVTAFSINSFLVLPLVSAKRGCADCPQKDSCPWMKRRR